MSPPLRPHLVDDGATLSLHFEKSQVQSRMQKAHPDHLILAYTRAMMGFLLLAPNPARIAMIGLGGGSLAKVCRRLLPHVPFTAVERCADVIALRDHFGIPADSPDFRVICADGAEWMKCPGEPVDVLLVDGFDGEGQPPALCTEAFYSDCAARLSDGGVLVVNLNTDAAGSGTGYGTYVRRIRDAFRGNLAVIQTEDAENKIVFACKGAFPAVLGEPVTLESRFFLGLADTGRRIEEARGRVG